MGTRTECVMLALDERDLEIIVSALQFANARADEIIEGFAPLAVRVGAAYVALAGIEDAVPHDIYWNVDTYVCSCGARFAGYDAAKEHIGG